MSGRASRGNKRGEKASSEEASVTKKATTTTAATASHKTTKETTTTSPADAPPPSVAAAAVAASTDAILPEGLGASPQSKEVLRTVFWPAADRRFDQISIEEDFQFDDGSQTITHICGRSGRQFPNTHFMRRLAGHLRLGLGRNATKEAILEKICEIHFGAAFTRPPVEDGGGGSSASAPKRKSSGGDYSSTVLKKRPVMMSRSKRGTQLGEAALKSRASALTAWSTSLDSMSNAIRQAEERLQSLCQAGGLNFYTALMDRSKIDNDYLRTQFAEYDNFLDLQKQMISSMTELGKGNEDAGTLNPIGAAAVAAALTPSASTIAAAVPAPEEAEQIEV